MTSPDSSSPEKRTPLSPPIPKQIGPYQIEKILGAGGMGTVYLGTHQETGKQAAVKMMPASMAHEEGFVARFGREIAAMKQLQSPHIVELYDNGEDHGTYYYSMEYVAGETLTDRLRREKRIPWREVIEIAVQVCRALKSAHNSGIIHRDLKPSNLLLGTDGVVKLSDFGIAQVFATSKLTVTGGVLGTAEYMSPEQAQGRRATRQSDIYSLGAVMYVMLTGRPPFTGKSSLEVIQKHRFNQFDSPRRILPDIPVWLDEVVCKCLSKPPEDRYPDANVLMLRLQEIPKKLEIKEFGSVGGAIDSESVTKAGETAVSDAGYVSGTLARDLFRMQAEADAQPRGIGRWLDNIWVLIGLLLLIVTGTTLLLWKREKSPEEMFRQAQAILEKPEGPEWDEARERLLVPLLDRDFEKWETQVSPLMAKVEAYDLKRQLLGRQKREPLPRSEPEAILRQVLQLQKLGQYSAAEQKLESLGILLVGNDEFKAFQVAIVQLQKDLKAQEVASRLEYVRKAMGRAGKFQKDGKTGEAQAIWRSVIALYDADSNASELVAEARAALAASGSIEPSPGSPPTTTEKD
ncbi:serine/threonine protein kinase [Planctomicrobium sp. SH527]|uniref:serine/threonine protein kinase n=1 Tax=Planctomicrobium sp. SH527 TaxID=3448123 RepID=UPI003F5AFA6F